ncbi:MAG: sugar ABC transporter permease [Bacilli bacterium]|nr:sugar ABC transporter permease [Bacilli bacterium]
MKKISIRSFKVSFQKTLQKIKTKISWVLYGVSVKIHNLFKKKPKTTKMSTARRQKKIFFWCLVALPLLQFLIFYIVVNINSIFLAFKSFDSETATFYFSGLGNFKNFIADITSDPTMVMASKNSLKLYLATLAFGLPLNLIFSFFIYKKIPGHGSFRVVLFLPQIISSLVVSLMFRYFVEEFLASIIGYNLLQSKDTGFATLIFYCIWASFGTQILIYTSAMSKIDESLVEAGKLDGMNYFQEFFRITLPLIYPTITIFLIVGVAGLFTSQASLFNFYGATARADLQTIGYIFFVKVFRNTEASFSQYPYAAAAGLLFTAVVVPITFLAKYLLEKFGPRVE